MRLYFHTNTEMALYYIKALLRDGDEHPMSEIYDYVMENCKGHAVMGEPMRATVISSALWRLYERAIRIVSRAERELAGSFYVNFDQGLDLKTSIEAQKAGREVLDKLGQIKAELAAMQQEFANEMECGQDQTSGMSMEL